MFLPQLFLLTVLAAMLSSRLCTPSPSSPGGIGRPRPPVGCVGESRSVGGIGFRAAPTQKESPPPSAVETDAVHGTLVALSHPPPRCHWSSSTGPLVVWAKVAALEALTFGPLKSTRNLFSHSVIETDVEHGTSEYSHQNSEICIIPSLKKQRA